MPNPWGRPRLTEEDRAAFRSNFESLNINNPLNQPSKNYTSDHELLLEIKTLLQNLEQRLSPVPGLIIQGTAVAEEWNKITQRRNT
jgi:hypothetical protein